MKTQRLSVLFIGIIGLVMLATGCPGQLGGDTDPDASTDMGGDFEVDESEHYYYVLVRDLEDSAPNDWGTNGSEIDAIALIHDGSSNFADRVDESGFGTGETSYTDVNQILGPPQGGDAGVCETDDPHFVSLGGTGGTGGYVIVSFYENGVAGDRQEIVADDVIRVYECGDDVERYEASIGIGTSVTDPGWIICGASMSGVAECVVPQL